MLSSRQQSHVGLVLSRSWHGDINVRNSDVLPKNIHFTFLVLDQDSGGLRYFKVHSYIGAEHGNKGETSGYLYIVGLVPHEQIDHVRK